MKIENELIKIFVSSGLYNINLNELRVISEFVKYLNSNSFFIIKSSSINLILNDLHRTKFVKNINVLVKNGKYIDWVEFIDEIKKDKMYIPNLDSSDIIENNYIGSEVCKVYFEIEVYPKMFDGLKKEVIKEWKNIWNMKH